jgi:hypothetical protein
MTNILSSFERKEKHDERTSQLLQVVSQIEAIFPNQTVSLPTPLRDSRVSSYAEWMGDKQHQYVPRLLLRRFSATPAMDDILNRHGLCTKITNNYKKRCFVQRQPTTSSVLPRLFVQSRLCTKTG